MPKALKSCPKSNKSPNLVTLFTLHCESAATCDRLLQFCREIQNFLSLRCGSPLQIHNYLQLVWKSLKRPQIWRLQLLEDQKYNLFFTSVGHEERFQQINFVGGIFGIREKAYFWQYGILEIAKTFLATMAFLSYQVFLPYIVSLIGKNNELLNGSLNTFDISDVFGYFWVLDNLGIVLGSLEFLLIIWTPVINLIKSLESQLKSLQS